MEEGKLKPGCCRRSRLSPPPTPGAGGGGGGVGGSSVFPVCTLGSIQCTLPLLPAQGFSGCSHCNSPVLGYQPGLLKVTSFPPRAQQGLAKAHHSPLEIITSQLAEWQGAWQEPGTSSRSAWAGKWLGQHPTILSSQRIHKVLCLSSLSPRPPRGSRVPGPHSSHGHFSLIPTRPGDRDRALSWVGFKKRNSGARLYGVQV